MQVDEHNAGLLHQHFLKCCECFVTLHARQRSGLQYLLMLTHILLSSAPRAKTVRADGGKAKAAHRAAAQADHQ